MFEMVCKKIIKYRWFKSTLIIPGLLKLIWRNYSYMYEGLLKCSQTDVISFVIQRVCLQILKVVLNTCVLKDVNVSAKYKSNNNGVWLFSPTFTTWNLWFFHSFLSLQSTHSWPGYHPIWEIFLYTLIGTINHRCLTILIDGKHKGILWFVSFFPARSNRRNLSGLNVEKTSQNIWSQSCFEAGALWCKSRRYCIPVVCQRPSYYLFIVFAFSDNQIFFEPSCFGSMLITSEQITKSLFGKFWIQFNNIWAFSTWNIFCVSHCSCKP